MKCVGLSIASSALSFLTPRSPLLWTRGRGYLVILFTEFLPAGKQRGFPQWEALVRDIQKAEQSHTTTPPTDRRLSQTHRARSSQSMLQEPPEVPKTLLKSSPCQNYLYYHTKTLFAFYTFIHPWLYGGIFPEATWPVMTLWLGQLWECGLLILVF